MLQRRIFIDVEQDLNKKHALEAAYKFISSPFRGPRLRPSEFMKSTRVNTTNALEEEGYFKKGFNPI